MNNSNMIEDMPVQLGFIYDQSRCVRCRTCEAACKSARNIEAGLYWRKTQEAWQGEFPEVKRTFLSISCMHCAEPACMSICPTGAIYKRSEDGLVLVDDEKCNGCKECFTACPYGMPQFGQDGKMQKCDYCTGLGSEPFCAVHCPTGALRFGDINAPIETAKGKISERYPGPTRPALIILKRVEKLS
jgi:anaerobic dimethyl sulfoxide reductase subunit B (iron-sulfur subunit)